MSVYPTLFNDATCVRKGTCPVTKLRGSETGTTPLESHELYYEQHGSGPQKVVFIMGLNSSSFTWLPQIDHFGHLDRYSCLVLDNRGVGNSSTPKGPYTTSAMAEDVIALLEFIGWNAPRQLHIVGTSLGGMISQELAWRIPERIISLTLSVTTPGGRFGFWTNLPPWKGTSSLARLIFTPEVDKKVPIILEMVFPLDWLDAKAEGDSAGRTNRQIQTKILHRRIQTTRPQRLMGALSQMAAGFTHYVSPQRLRVLSSTIPRILIVTGDQDHLILPFNSRYLKKYMPEAEFVEFKDTGHGINAQRKERFNELLESHFVDALSRLDSGN